MIFAGPDNGGGHFKALKNWEHRSYKKIVIPWLDHGTQVMKAEFYKDANTWVLGRGPRMTRNKLMVSRKKTYSYKKIPKWGFFITGHELLRLRNIQHGHLLSSHYTCQKTYRIQRHQTLLLLRSFHDAIARFFHRK